LPIIPSAENNNNDEKLDVEACLTDIEAYCNSYSTNNSVLSALKENFIVETKVSFIIYNFYKQS
jgi:hypothetical protein